MDKRRIAAVAMVKDECDIIELFVRINARVIDHFFILDNGSSDATLQILKQLGSEGLPLSIFSDDSVAYPQDVITTKLVREAAQSGDFGWIAPLDADEFIQADKESLLAELSALPANTCGLMNWSTFVPAAGDYFACDNPLWGGFRRGEREARQQSKVVIPGELALSGAVTMGNHNFVLWDGETRFCDSRPLKTRLAHVPIRSSDQLVSKVIIGSHQYSIKKDRRPGTGFHWDVIAAAARANDYSLDEHTLRKTALAYVARPGDPVVERLDPEDRVGREDDRMVYRDLARINLRRRFDAFMQRLCGEIRSKW